MLASTMITPLCTPAGTPVGSASPPRAVIGSLVKHVRRAAGAATATLSIAAALASGMPSQALAAPDVTAAISVGVFWTDPTKFFAANDYLLMANVYESLYGHDEKGALIPTLATGVEIKDDGLTYEFTSRPNVKFHNGDAFNAEDVRLSWQKAAPAAPFSTVGINSIHVKKEIV